MKDYPSFHFELKKIQEYQRKLDIAEQIEYLEFVQVEQIHFLVRLETRGSDLNFATLPESKLDQRFFIYHNDLKQYLENELKHLKTKYKWLLESEQIGDKKPEKSNEKINNPIESNTKIQWNGTEGQLIYLIKALKENNFLPQNQNDEPYAFIEKYFVNKQGKPFKQKQLSQTKYQYEISKTGRPKKSKIIDEIIDETNKQN